jgi:Domain of unknown function (DUF4145)
MFFEIKSPNAQQVQGQNNPASIRCPACKQYGTLDALGVPDLLTAVPGFGGQLLFGQRRCPNPACHKHVFIIIDAGRVAVAYPPERLDFDSTNIPIAVKNAFEEAIACHSQQCFVASAIMVRKTLEELCSDKGATGDNLKERIQALGKHIVLPRELLAGADNLRLLGNDAAHIESQEYQQVGKEEVELAIEFAKELLKSTYQYSSLLKKFDALKKGTTTPTIS